MPRLLPWFVVAALVAGACGDFPVATPPAAAGEAAPLASLPPLNAATTTTTTATTTTTTTTRAPRPSVVLGFAGDVSFTHGLDRRDPLGDVIDLLSTPDFTTVNLETTVAEPGVGRRVAKTYIFKSPPGSIDLLTSAGIDAVSLANNHTLDYRRDGLLRTIELLEAGAVTHFGAGEDEADAYAPAIAEVGAWRLGFVGFTHVECGWVADDPTLWPEAAWACPGFEDRTVAAVAEAAGLADVVVVMVHWGIEKDHCPQPYQRALGRAWVEAGADLVIGSHPHVLQGIERIDESWIVYSTGNFAFPSARGPSAKSAYFTVAVSEQGLDLDVIPIELVGGRPRLMSPGPAGDLLDDLGRWSFGFVVDGDGGVVPGEASGACD